MATGIKKLVIELPDGKEITIKPDDAEQLYRELDKIFGRKTEYVPYYRYTKPWYYDFYSGNALTTGNNTAWSVAGETIKCSLVKVAE